MWDPSCYFHYRLAMTMGYEMWECWRCEVWELRNSFPFGQKSWIQQLRHMKLGEATKLSWMYDNDPWTLQSWYWKLPQVILVRVGTLLGFRLFIPLKPCRCHSFDWQYQAVTIQSYNLFVDLLTSVNWPVICICTIFVRTFWQVEITRNVYLIMVLIWALSLQNYKHICFSKQRILIMYKSITTSSYWCSFYWQTAVTNCISYAIKYWKLFSSRKLTVELFYESFILVNDQRKVWFGLWLNLSGRAGHIQLPACFLPVTIWPPVLWVDSLFPWDWVSVPPLETDIFYILHHYYKFNIHYNVSERVLHWEICPHATVQPGLEEEVGPFCTGGHFWCWCRHMAMGRGTHLSKQPLCWQHNIISVSICFVLSILSQLFWQNFLRCARHIKSFW